jgi:hypothetical protein
VPIKPKIQEETIYNYQPSSIDESTPIFSGSQNNIIPIAYIRKNARNNKGDLVSYFEGPCLVLTKDGSAGLITYKEKGLFAINHHACVLKLKETWKEKLDIEWFAQQYPSYLYQYVTSKSDNRVFSTKWFDRVQFEIPSYSLQIRQKNKKRMLLQLKSRIESTLNRLGVILEQVIVNLTYVTHENVELSKVLYFKGGNSGLTEDFIYYNQPTNEEESIEILSSATLEENRMGCIFRNAKPNGKKLKIFRGPAILVARNGYAGSMTYIPSGDFTTNDHAYVLTPKKDWEKKINLKWFIHEYQDLFFNLVTSKSDNATFNKEYANRQTVKIPDMNFQNEFVEKIEYIESIITKLNEIEKEIDEGLECAIV